MHVKHAEITTDGYLLGTALVIWLATTAWMLERITASLYGAAIALINMAARAAAGS